ncbi:hypothetical protein A2531_02880 [Candidatus Falkowbacteria bacterium RIFOXYD2_FULL_34_120]|uniref:Uncharacterized protein n=1 Tax=Candidatus Falkowbacteria bacterium RIFOXYD2_FULL_34_120 TaxID=1798007 RepID=A0A1F5TPP2_9BACT|nr:MAG: hypothetical protein A2500_00465 [Candidatus Falkowbacteria bacterium RIFOXYC12_FULL_34_55]OGF40491.1 MAG: hypothetical protein A2531_02880 [Candidatus Falkowbacteria bacterium RIFOXYD2_FULL_34_120]
MDLVAPAEREKVFKNILINLNIREKEKDWWPITSHKGILINDKWTMIIWEMKKGQVAVIYDAKILTISQTGIDLRSAEGKGMEIITEWEKQKR